MKYDVQWQKKATKQLLKLMPLMQKRITAAVEVLKDSQTWTNVKALTNHQYSHRLRVGDYRVLFDADTSPELEAAPDEPEEIRILDIQEVKKRDEKTY